MPTNGDSFINHQGSEAQDVGPAFLATISASQPTWRAGGSVFLPRYIPATGQRIATTYVSDGAYALADPETHKLEEPFADRGRGKDHYPYLRESDPGANRTRFVRNVAEAQLSAGTGVIISPWLTHGTDAVGRHLRSTLRFATETFRLYGGEGHEILIGVAATEAVIADDAGRDDLLDELVELPDAPIYFRIRVTPPESYTQYANDTVLEGLFQFVAALARNGRDVLLPQSGLSGWLMMGAGAVAFGSGRSASLQRFALASPDFGRRPLEWFFLPQLLGFVLREEASEISRLQNYVPCTCPYCDDIDLTIGPLDRRAAADHYMWWCARLANEFNEITQIRQQLADAQAFWNDVQQSSLLLDRRSEPRHLAVWSQVAAL